MGTNDCPWRNCKSIKLLKTFYLPTVGIIGLLPAILIINYSENNYFILFATAYCLLIQQAYLLLTRYVDRKLKKNWFEINK